MAPKSVALLQTAEPRTRDPIVDRLSRGSGRYPLVLGLKSVEIQGSRKAVRASGNLGRGDEESERKRAVAIVEDELELLSIYSTYLKSKGYDSVFAFVSGEEFLGAMVEGRISPEVVLIDYRLPGRNGIETARRFVELNPRTKVIVTTADDSIAAEANLLGFHFLLKPFPLASLSNLLSRV